MTDLDKLRAIAATVAGLADSVRHAAIAAAITEHGFNLDQIRAAAQKALADAEAGADNDDTITPELVGVLGDIVIVATPEPELEPEPAPVEETPEPEPEPEPVEGEIVDAESTETTGDTTMGDETPSKELATAGAGAGDQVTFSSSRRIEVPGALVPTRRPDREQVGNARFAAFSAGDNSQTLETRASMGELIADQMSRLSRGGPGRYDRKLVQFNARDDWDIARVHRQMSDVQVQEQLDLAVMSHNEQFANTGWCSPSQDVYEFCGMPSLDGIISLPSILIERGGVRFPTTPPFASLIGQGVTCQTEAEAMAREEDKNCVELGCPEWVEHRENVCSLCITSSILTNRTFPEWVSDQVNRLLVAYEHYMAANIINAMVDAAGDPIVMPTAAPHSVTEAFLSAVEFIRLQIQYRERLSKDHPINIAPPAWLVGAIRADVAKRTGVDMLGLSDQRINELLEIRGPIRVQWAKNWQDALFDGPESESFGSDASLQSGMWPAKAQILAWPEGAFVLGRETFLTINGLYDSALLKQNKHLQLFTEQAWALIPRCYESHLIEIDVCATGTTSAPVEFACPTL